MLVGGLDLRQSRVFFIFLFHLAFCFLSLLSLGSPSLRSPSSLSVRSRSSGLDEHMASIGLRIMVHVVTLLLYRSFFLHAAMPTFHRGCSSAIDCAIRQKRLNTAFGHSVQNTEIEEIEQSGASSEASGLETCFHTSLFE